MRTTTGRQGRDMALLMITLLCGCAAVSTRTAPTGDSVLARDGVTFQVPTGGMRVLESHPGNWLLAPHLSAEDGSNGIMLKATIKSADPGDCRAQYSAKLDDVPGYEPNSVSRQTRGQFSVIEYTSRESPDPRFEGTRLDQRNAVGCVTLGGATAFLHLSKVKYTAQDEKTFERLFEQARVTGE